MKYSMEMSLFSVKLPKYGTKNEAEKGDPKMLIARMEQIFSNFLYLKETDFIKKIFSDPPKAVLEIASESGGSDISFYFCVPNSYAPALPKYIEGAYPEAIVESIPNDYTIFDPNANVAVASLRLKKPIYFPLNTYKNLETDPLEAITNSLTNISPSEGAAIQIVIRPSVTDVKKNGEAIISKITAEGKDLKEAVSSVEQSWSSIFSGLFSPSPKKEDKEQIKEKKVDDETIEILRNKIRKPFFEANIRLISSAGERPRAEEILQNMESSFAQFFSPHNNFLSARIKGKRARKAIYDFIFRNFDERQKIFLNLEELASIYHVPLPHMESPNINWAKVKEVEPPANLPLTGPVLIGKALYRGGEKDVYVASRDDRRRHFYIVGQTSVGKSSLLKEMLRQDIEKGEGVAVIDPHGELVEDILSC
ncbi:MAG: DUF87 domain-containing protein, partial [Candidatus Pacebacteria bacterium]|nr:DUF87 domain-containing protein [Candidatus Paceibacterota bacterium]